MPKQYDPTSIGGPYLKKIENLPHILYRFYDAADRLLYVGITFDFEARCTQHESAEWWALQVRHTIEDLPDRTQAKLAEYRAIVGEGPLHNVRHVHLPGGEGRGAGRETRESLVELLGYDVFALLDQLAADVVRQVEEGDDAAKAARQLDQFGKLFSSIASHTWPRRSRLAAKARRDQDDAQQSGDTSEINHRVA